MGLVRGAFRTTRRVTRTTYSAGRSVARGRVPSVGVGFRVPGGFGVRVGTRGVAIRTPIARQSIGLSGFRTTVGVPGIAHITVDPTRPSLTTGVGPLQAMLARNPGVSLASRFISVGVTTQPLLWARLGHLRIKMPGQVQQSGGLTWHEEIDRQWQHHYNRRPPSVSEQLHSIIHDMESALVAAATIVLTVPSPAALPRPVLDPVATAAHRKAARKAGRSGVALLARRKRRAAVAKAVIEHELWAQEEQAALDHEHARLTALINGAMAAWRKGDPATVFVVANAMLGAGGANGSLVSLMNDVATMLVFAPPLEDVHPCKPGFSPGGAPTVYKRTKPERLEAHRVLTGASAVSALNAVRNAIPGVRQIDVVVVLMSSTSGRLGDCPVAATFTANYGTMPRSADGFARLIDQHALASPKTLSALLPDLFRGGNDDLAIVAMCESVDDLKLPEFWLEVSAASAVLNPTGTQ